MHEYHWCRRYNTDNSCQETLPAPNNLQYAGTWHPIHSHPRKYVGQGQNLPALLPPEKLTSAS
ncbi:hypothetical protein DSECCO2_638960 [anaerobic digester metagenome]